MINTNVFSILLGTSSSSNTTEANGVDINAQRVQYREEDGGGNEGEGLVCVCVCVLCVCVPCFFLLSS